MGENVPKIEPFVFKPVSQEQVDNYISHISNKTATGLDNVSAKVLKIIRPAFSVHLTRTINRMFSEAVFPSEMKSARVTPIFKKEGLPSEKVLPSCECITYSIEDFRAGHGRPAE